MMVLYNFFLQLRNRIPQISTTYPNNNYIYLNETFVLHFIRIILTCTYILYFMAVENSKKNVF